ncbi:hypothetical protein F4777DRAFT_393696 [Nemania sp. FL0916]|nr:hypothetical protein F4777DRAFT_393696 [Nemania sp. FL0916]
MLRTGGTRAILQVSSRAAAGPRRSISTLPRWSTSAFHQRVAIAQREVRRPVPAWLSPFGQQRTSFATKTSSSNEGASKEGKESSSNESSIPNLASGTADSMAHDLKIIQETFSLAGAPKEPYWLGLAGTLPYLGTSISTVYLAWVLNTPWPAASTVANNFLISQETATQMMSLLEPIQLGYGAVIISFLGAIHWGLEYAEKVPDAARTRFRYTTGVMAPIVAWPTLLLPVEFALTAQFAALVAMYFADARAVVRGWAPAWYSTYRFALTAMVGVAVVISLIGRAKVGSAKPRLTGLGDKFHEHHGEEPFTEKWHDREEKDKVEMKKKEEEEAKKKEEEEKEKKKKEKKGKTDKKAKDEKAEDEDGEAESNDEAKANKDGDGDGEDGEDEKKDGDADHSQDDGKEKEKGDKK